jgi:hypothetical protein
MMPGNDYKFPGNMVLEVPMLQNGGQPLKAWEYIDDEGYLNTDLFKLPIDLRGRKKYAEDLNWMSNWIPNRKPQMQAAIQSYMNRMDEKHPADGFFRKHVFSPIFGEPSAYNLSSDWGLTTQEFGENILRNAANNVNTVNFRDNSKVNPKSYVPSAYGVYSPAKHSIYYDNEPSPETRIHEIGHSTKLGSNRIFTDLIRDIVKKDPIYKSNFDDYYHSPEEIYSGIWEMRRVLDLKPSDIITRSSLKKKLEENRNLDIDILRHLKPDTIIRLLNELVYQEPKSEMPMGANSGLLPKAQDGKEKTSEIKYGTPEYNKAYDEGTIVRQVDDQTVAARMLPEVTITPKYTSLYRDLGKMLTLGTKEALEVTGIPGTIRFVRNPGTSLKGAGNTLVDLGMLYGSSSGGRNIAEGLQYYNQGINPITGERSFRNENVEGAFNTLDALGMATGIVSALKAPVTAGMKQAVNTIPKGVVDYGKDLVYSIPRGKLPQYANAVRWQPDEIPGFLKAGNLDLTDEQKALKGSWYGYDPATFNSSLSNPNQKSDVLSGLGFYPQTRPGPGNVLVNRLSERQIRNLEKSANVINNFIRRSLIKRRISRLMSFLNTEKSLKMKSTT